MRIFLVAMCLLAIALTACDTTSAPVSESGSSTSQTQVEESGPALLLSEDSAILILQTYLQDCVLSWSVEHESYFKEEMERGRPLPSDEEQKWWMDLATGSVGDTVWSAQYYGVTDFPAPYNRRLPSTETWVVIGPGLQRATGELEIVPGRWKVYAGHRIAYSLDAPARLAMEEYKKPLDTYFDSDCSGYSER